jgi:hypothetical protein
MPQLAPERATVSPSASLEDLIAGLRRLVGQNRRRWKVVIALEAVSLAVAAPLAYLWLVFFLDNQMHLPVAGRVLASAGFLAGVAWAGWLLARRWRSLRLSEDEVALAIERHTPGQVHNRLINAVQIARDPTPARRQLSEAVVQENYERLQQMRLERAARLRPALCRLGLAVLLVGVGLGYALWQPDLLGNAAARIFLPLAEIDPLYRTRLEVSPGDVEAAGDVTLRISIEGERPVSLTIFKRQQGQLSSEVVPVPAGDGPVAYTFRDVTRDFTYAVRGGDFTSRFFQVIVPQRASLARVRARYHYPAYTGLADKTVESTGGDLEALQGTRAQVTFRFDQPVDRVGLVLSRPAVLRDKREPRPVHRQEDGREHTAEILFEDVLGYRLEIGQGDRPAERTAPFAIRVLKDQPPKLELVGLEQRMEVQPDSVLPLQIFASDDFGLEKVGLFFRRAVTAEGRSLGEDETWKAVAEWPGQRKTSLRVGHELAVAGLGVAEGETVELALRGVDTDPHRQGTWTTGSIYQLAVGGEGVGLQLRYEQILRSEGQLKALARSEQEVLGKAVTWLRKLDGGGEVRWDDPKNVDALHAAIKALGQEQDQVQKAAGELARAMVAESGNVRIAVGLLADTEMARVIRILESVPTREQPQAKRAALADGRVTLERILRSLEDLHEQYAAFRSDWELSHMIPFTKMLAQRQTRLGEQSRQYGGRGAGTAEKLQRQSLGRRQQKILDLCQLIQPAFVGLGERLKEQDSTLAAAFQAGAATLAGEGLRLPLRQATQAVQAGRWAEAARQQAVAADLLTSLHARLRAAQLEAARKALAALKERAKSDLAAQKELEKLDPGSAERYVKDYPDNFKVEDLQRIWEVAGAKKSAAGKDEEPDFKNAPFDEVDRKVIELEKDSGVRQDPYVLKLGTEAEKTGAIKLYAGKDKNAVKPFIQEKFDDLVGRLLNEADEMHKEYQKLNLSTNRNNNDGGDIGKIGGRLNSTGAVTATGNKKPPTLEVGGVARTGRQGARAYGMVADDDTYNRKGRDQALEGQQEVADQAGRNKMRDTDENQKDTSTGVGGKRIASDDTHFSLHDAGKWKDEHTKRLEKPQQKNYLVERQGDKLDPKVAALLRDMTSKQEQIIERLKAIKKELRNLYLPTEHLDELAAALEANLASLKERPEVDLFRMQMQALDRLSGALRVFRSASNSYQPSLPRERAIRGRVLDEPARPVLPGYEEAVKQYFLRLATQ